MVAGRPRSMLVALLVRSCASAIAVPPTARITVDAAAYGRAKRRAVSESWSHKLEVEDFLTRADFLARARVASDPPARPPPMVLDVRAPCEYEKGHIPGALSFPLFDDAERAEVCAQSVSHSLPHSYQRSTWPTLTLWSSVFRAGWNLLHLLSSGRVRTSG